MGRPKGLEGEKRACEVGQNCLPTENRVLWHNHGVLIYGRLSDSCARPLNAYHDCIVKSQNALFECANISTLIILLDPSELGVISKPFLATKQDSLFM